MAQLDSNNINANGRCNIIFRMSTLPLNTLPAIFVISLARAADRRADISQRLEAAGFFYQIVEGIDGTNPEILKNTPHQLDDRLHQYTHGRRLSGGKIDCYLSHYRLWEKIVADNIDCTLVFEDDARWEDDLAQSMVGLSAKTYNGIVRLFD